MNRPRSLRDRNPRRPGGIAEDGRHAPRKFPVRLAGLQPFAQVDLEGEIGPLGVKRRRPQRGVAELENGVADRLRDARIVDVEAQLETRLARGVLYNSIRPPGRSLCSTISLTPSPGSSMIAGARPFHEQ